MRADDDDTLRVIAHPQTFAGFLDRAFGALAQYASADMIAGQRFLGAIGDIALSCHDFGRVATLRRQVEAFRALAGHSLAGANLGAVQERADQLLWALAKPDYQRRLRDASGWLGGTG